MRLRNPLIYFVITFLVVTPQPFAVKRITKTFWRGFDIVFIKYIYLYTIAFEIIEKIPPLLLSFLYFRCFWVFFQNLLAHLLAAYIFKPCNYSYTPITFLVINQETLTAVRQPTFFELRFWCTLYQKNIYAYFCTWKFWEKWVSNIIFFVAVKNGL